MVSFHEHFSTSHNVSIEFPLIDSKVRQLMRFEKKQNWNIVQHALHQMSPTAHCFYPSAMVFVKEVLNYLLIILIPSFKKVCFSSLLG